MLTVWWEIEIQSFCLFSFPRCWLCNRKKRKKHLFTKIQTLFRYQLTGMWISVWWPSQMKFSNGANMRRHKQRHTGVKPYECRVCQKRFFRKDHLAEHFTTHTKTLPYHCPICNRGFQRQIAMRAHFQNEHVGQHELVKTCPLCSYRAGTMKSLRVHFFNRHGIDLDNPGTGTPSSLLLALEQSNSAHLLPALAAAANASANAFSDSGDSARSNDNATPPMHFLTPHVEISMGDGNGNENGPMRLTTNGTTNGNNNNNHDQLSNSQPTTMTATTSSGLDIQAIVRPLITNGGSPVSPQSADSNSNIPTSSHSSSMTSEAQSSRHMMYDNPIKPSISLIPIKQVSWYWIWINRQHVDLHNDDNNIADAFFEYVYFHC